MRIVVPGDVGSYSYAAVGYANPHAVTSVGGTTYTYDNNGNVTAIGSLDYTWDWRVTAWRALKGVARVSLHMATIKLCPECSAKWVMVNPFSMSESLLYAN